MPDPSGRQHLSQAALAATSVLSNQLLRMPLMLQGAAALTPPPELRISLLLVQSLLPALLCHGTTCDLSVTRQRASSALSPLFNAHSPLHLDQSNQAPNLISQGVSQLRMTSKRPRLRQPLAIE